MRNGILYSDLTTQEIQVLIDFIVTFWYEKKVGEISPLPPPPSSAAPIYINAHINDVKNTKSENIVEQRITTKKIECFIYYIVIVYSLKLFINQINVCENICKHSHFQLFL